MRSETIDVSVVVPVYRNRDTLEELYADLSHVLAERRAYELLFVNDACPEGSLDTLRRLARDDPRVAVLDLERNVGQHRAVLAGLAKARGRAVVVMDADLQDPPEEIPRLLSRLQAGFAAVFAGRRGRYSTWPRSLSSRAFKRLLSLLSGGRLPPDAGLFVAMTREMVDRLGSFELDDPYVLSLMARTALPMVSVPVERRPAPTSRSSYTFRARWKTGLKALKTLLLARDPACGASFLERHNREQRAYFERTKKPTMVPCDSPYVNRHVDELIAFAGIRPGDPVIEVGCGMGRYTLPLASRDVQVTGLDLSPVLLAELDSHSGRRIPTVPADIMNPPDELHGRFAFVVGFFTLHHLHDLAACFAGMSRLLREGGRVCFLEPNPLNPLFYIQVAITPGMTWAGDKGLVKMRTSILAPALSSAGFRDLEMRRFGFFPPSLANRPAGAAFEKRLERVPVWRPFLPFQLLRGSRP